MVWGLVVVCESFYRPSRSIIAEGSTGWPAVVTCMVGLAMGEVCSAHPTSGGPYFWAAMLSDPQHAAFASWVTGWFNLLGQVAVTTGIRYEISPYV